MMLARPLDDQATKPSSALQAKVSRVNWRLTMASTVAFRSRLAPWR